MSGNDKYIYVGPQHFWHEYALDPRNRWYFGIGGLYGKERGPACYWQKVDESGAPVATEFSKEQFGVSDGVGRKLFWVLGALALVAYLAK